jgi:hypothetical protein
MDGVSMYTDEAPDFGISAEVSTKTYGATAETLGAGAQVEMVVKSGGNEFHGRLREEYLDRKMSSTNVDANLRSQGIQAGDALLFSNDFVGDLGGRIVRHRLLAGDRTGRSVRNDRRRAGRAAGEQSGGNRQAVVSELAETSIHGFL